MNEYTNGSATIGPWLKDYSFNNSHYSITVSQDGLGTVNVFNATGTNETTATGSPGCSASARSAQSVSAGGGRGAPATRI